jgi:hypothetical protein
MTRHRFPSIPRAICSSNNEPIKGDQFQKMHDILNEFTTVFQDMFTPLKTSVLMKVKCSPKES